MDKTIVGFDWISAHGADTSAFKEDARSDSVVHRPAAVKSLRSEYHRSLVAVLSATRRECKVTQDDLAKGVGWHRSRVAKIESGERRVDVPEFIFIANALRIDPKDLSSRVLNW
jgi:DNA-binding XRE family transcriptional regulator